LALQAGTVAQPKPKRSEPDQKQDKRQQKIRRSEHFAKLLACG
jgi:hypothetical protein